MPFDEGRLWKGDHAAELKRQLQETFQNITRVMDCVGCEKCKLWGKLQTLGESCRHLMASLPRHPASHTHALCSAGQISTALRTRRMICLISGTFKRSLNCRLVQAFVYGRMTGACVCICPSRGA